MQRTDLLQLIEAALASAQLEYAQSLASRYLKDQPNDWPMQFALARAHALMGDHPTAIAVLERLVIADPEAFAAQRALGEQLLKTPKLSQAALAFASAYIGDGKPPPAGLRLPEWTGRIRAAYLAEQVGDGEKARREAEIALTTESASPLPALIYLSAFWHAGRTEQARELAEKFSTQWPQTVAFKLCLAECLFQAGDYGRALRLLHDAAAQDTAGQVAARHWGDSHPYTALWDAPPTMELTAPLPAALLAALGLNRLKGKVTKVEESKTLSESASPIETLSPELADIQSELESLAGHLNGKNVSQAWYLALSSRKKLIQRFGEDSFAALDAAMRQLIEQAAARNGLTPALIYVDDSDSLEKYEQRPVNANKAWDIKLLVHGVNDWLTARNDRLGALLIVGGADIIPFHHLPNPTDDPDADIPSDNPYATADENYFIPEWPVGRLPSPSAELLLKAIQTATLNQRQGGTLKPKHWMMRIWEWVMRQFSRPEKPVAVTTSFGYTANIWKEASVAVYDPIGNPSDLLTCPPVDTSRLPSEGLAPARMSYFNLHGVEDGAEWYGQRAATDPDNVPEYPVALRPSDVVNSGRAPQVVFSEACYGANIIHKQHSEEALCLRFIECGTQAVIGSTKIAYGSVSTPLIGADLLGRAFWQNVTSGLPVGEALRQAKLHLANEMHLRQGCLDGEDQKTLLSFVLYGDPLAVMTTPEPTTSKEAKRRILHTAPQRISVTDKATGPARLSEESIAQIKSVVAQYLPAMRSADVVNAQTRAYQPLGAKTSSSSIHTVVTLSKTIRTNTRAHPHFARVTLNAQGKVIKVAVSR